MKIRAAIFDIYGTLLEVSPPPADAEARWQALWNRQFRGQPRLGLAEFGDQCDQIVRREHAAARARGIPFPEIFWSAVISEVLPELDHLTDLEREDFLYDQAQIWHTVQLMPEAKEALQQIQTRGVLLGLASNAQSYTERELGTALDSAGLNARLFQPDICFWSFKHGFSKPDPHVFQILTARLQVRGIRPAEILMVGDRLDCDIEPAQAHGWQTWHLSASTATDAGGGWSALALTFGP
jgi:FMN phosphatase YigB (HAD superfamily)